MLDPKTTRKLSGFSDDIYKLQNELEKLFKQVEEYAKLGNIEQLNLCISNRQVAATHILKKCQHLKLLKSKQTVTTL